MPFPVELELSLPHSSFFCAFSFPLPPPHQVHLLLVQGCFLVNSGVCELSWGANLFIPTPNCYSFSSPRACSLILAKHSGGKV